MPGVFTGECGDGQYLKGDMRGRAVDTKMGDEGSEVGGMDSLFRETVETVRRILEDGGDLNFENQIPGVCRMRNRRIRGNMPMREDFWRWVEFRR